MAEYSVEEVRARFEAWVSVQTWFKATIGLKPSRNGDEFADPCINSRWQGWQAAYAERIKADESAVPYGWVNAIGELSAMRKNSDDIAVFTHPSAQAAQLWEMKQRACRAHALCNELRLAHPEIPELGDDGVLHDAIHDILRVDTPTAAPVQAAQVDESAALAHFTDYFVRNYPGPDTIIYDPKWHAPKIFRAAQYAIANATTTPPTAEPVAQGEAVDEIARLKGVIERDRTVFCNLIAGLKRELKTRERLGDENAARLVDVEKVREVIAELRDYDEADATGLGEWADKLTAALQEPDRG